MRHHCASAVFSLTAGRGASGAAFPRGAWERSSSRLFCSAFIKVPCSRTTCGHGRDQIPNRQNRTCDTPTGPAHCLQALPG
ncbi:hypothetical protein EUX57_23635 [Pseudomonas orientalis]|uniref:DUF1534 domain-containing protein n=1 Tax=Pseudomonas orientalis TaxID=76758 RepID=A0A4Q7CSV5_9PSED|nr:hypothetical protein EUX57_23635 [Pseudomonas orientalis]